ncbi:MAG: hypothetical protein V3V01_18525 [Acidimicrobiales bacterium]
MRVLVFGQPKSGTTALMRSVSEALPDSVEVFEPDDLTAVDLTPDHLVVKKLFGPHDRGEGAVYDAFDQCLFIVRDPRDRFISSLLYDAHGRIEADDPSAIAPFLEMLEAKEADPLSVPLLALHHEYWKFSGVDLFSAAARAAQRMRAFWRNQGTQWTLVRYEDFVTGNTAELATLLGVDTLAQPIIDGDLARVARTRAHGDWRNWLTPADMFVFEPFATPILAEFGYANDWTLAEVPSIDRANASDYVRKLIASR